MRPYHRGTLREEALDEAARIVETDGIGALTLRELARRLEVSHAAPAHHFGDRQGLLTALATQGFARLAAALDVNDFLEAAVAYVRFATVDERGRFTVMFATDALRADDTELLAARAAADDVFRRGLATVTSNSPDEALAAHALVHGLAQLYNSGSVARADDAVTLARRLAPLLFERE